MDTIEASKMVMSRIQSMDPKNASKIMGYLLLQHQTENEMIRLAFAPENLLALVIKQAKSFLDISSNTWSSSPRIVMQQSNSYSHINHPHSSTGFWQNGDEMCTVGSSSPTSIDGFEDFLRFKAIQQQRAVAMAAGGPHLFSFNRCIHSPNRSPSAAAASWMMGERHDRHDLVAMGLRNSSSSSRQIYLTFPADSSFKEEDVSNYFRYIICLCLCPILFVIDGLKVVFFLFSSIFGPVQDVRIPHQQKRMFGFVSFVFVETVKSILAKGNPHFICDSRVLVKPYKDKEKVPIKKHWHQIVRGDFSALEHAEPFDHIPFGARMFNHDMMLRRNLKGRDEYQETVDFQERKLMNMQLTTDHQLQHNLSNSQTNKSLVHVNSLNVYGEEINCSDTQEPLTDSKATREVNDDDKELISGKEDNSDLDGTYNHESFEHILPDNLFASPTKAGDSGSISQTSLNMASLKSC
ncbi:hypothetical protein SSX86_008034 [Deinandra increscens subsp. villosa]|uniref:AtC3H46-like PABC-like domain-containing protein n=1 Tax=Deinandra increscens subsp. villosa TaxID=3103831 RepID=A0AAP0DAI8_9ASTR